MKKEDGTKQGPGESPILSVRVPQVLWDRMVKQAKAFGTTVGWIALQCIAQFFRDELPPNYQIGMPRREWPDETGDKNKENDRE